jgi:ELWxxDGT repeat protein
MTFLSRVYPRAGSSPRRPKSTGRHRDMPPRLEALESRTLLSLTPQLVANINTVGAGSSPQDFTAVGATTFFLANDVVHGQELWKTNGSAAGTSLVKDINPGPAGSSIFGMTNLNGTLLFFANDGVHGNELWKSNGTAAGTTLVDDINPGPGSSDSYSVSTAVIGGTMYFGANDGTHSLELWKTNGTTAGTTLVKDINPGPDDSNPNQLTTFDGKLYFSANDGTDGYELWQSDGTTAGTTLFDDINPGSSGSYPSHFATSGGNLYFVADDGTDGRDLWKSDGTTAGTAIFTTNLDAQRLTDVNGTLYFESQFQLWKTDGTVAGTTLVSTESDPRYMTSMNGKVYFSAYDATNGRELWETDGTMAGTTLVKDISPGSGSSYPGIGYSLGLGQFAVLGGKLYFGANDGTDGNQLWSTDGTSAGTKIVDNINPGSITTNGQGAAVTSIAAVNGRIFFQANDGTHGSELWTSLGKASATSLVKDIDLTDAGSYPTEFSGSGGVTYFQADGELWKTDGSARGTSLLNPAIPSQESFADFNGKLIFGAADAHGSEMWQSDGTAGGTTLLKDINPGSGSSYPNGFTNFDGKLIFSANDGSNGDELWISDGTVLGTTLLKDINPAQGYTYYGNYYPGYPQGSYPRDFTAMGGSLYFAADDGSVGDELWKTDGTAAGTTLVADINPGSTTDYYGDVNPKSSAPQDLTAFNGLLFFSANDGSHGRELWESDGTASGTHLVADITPGRAGSYPVSLTIVGSKLFFEANDGVHGTELWESDGTAAGTVMVKDINPGSTGSTSGSAATLIDLDGSLLFTADDGTHGMELWRSDGTSKGTVMVKDINPGNAGSLSASYPSTFAIAGGLLFFAADDGTHGRELWESDGTASGTRLVADINPGGGNAFPASGQVITDVDGSLYLAANDGVHGIEPWVIPASQFVGTPASVRRGPITNPGLSSRLAPAATTVPAAIASSFGTRSGGYVSAAISLAALPVPSPWAVRAQARTVGPLGPLGSSLFRPGPRAAPTQLFSDGPIGSFLLGRTFLDRNALAG